jgi:hypothetical protein
VPQLLTWFDVAVHNSDLGSRTELQHTQELFAYNSHCVKIQALERMQVHPSNEIQMKQLEHKHRKGLPLELIEQSHCSA